MFQQLTWRWPDAIALGGAAAVALVAAIAWFDPAALLPVLLLGPAILAAMLVVRFPVPGSVAWLLIAGSSPEMWLGAIVPGSESTDTAMVKLAGLALVVVMIFRDGFRFDWCNPALAFIVVFALGLAHGLLPQLTVGDSARSLIGSAAPFAFAFSRLSRRWCRAMITATIWVSPAIVAFGGLLAALHLYPMLAVDEGVRLSGSTHPAFLAGFAMTGVFASLVELFRDGRHRHQATLALNFAILVASGGRAPLFCAVVVTAIAFVAIPAPTFPRVKRLPTLLFGGILLAAAIAVASVGSDIRIFALLSGEAANLSNRDLIWPLFQEAFEASPWFGWGIGAGKDLVDPESLLAHLLGTTAAHNEYLRMGVEGGIVGLVLVIGSLGLWGYLSTRKLWRGEKIILRLVLVALAIHSITDNTLIAATASVYFAWLTAVFSRGRLEAAARPAPSWLVPAVARVA